MFPAHPYTCKFFYPHDATYATATAAITLKAPERGDRRSKGRNQVFNRLKNGTIVVYDTGTKPADILKLSFEYVPLSEFSALMVFFDAVVWGANPIKYVDYKGDEYIVRVYKNEIESINQGEAKPGYNELTQYDFTLDLIDITTNVADIGQTAVPTQLALHLADYAHPHNPATATSVSSTDGTKIIETVSAYTYKTVTWIINLTYSTTYSRTLLLHATHDGTTLVDATTVSTASETLVSNGTVPSDYTLSVTLSGTGENQVMQLKATKTADTMLMTVRRIKL